MLHAAQGLLADKLLTRGHTFARTCAAGVSVLANTHGDISFLSVVDATIQSPLNVKDFSTQHITNSSRVSDACIDANKDFCYSEIGSNRKLLDSAIDAHHGGHHQTTPQVPPAVPLSICC